MYIHLYRYEVETDFYISSYTLSLCTSGEIEMVMYCNAVNYLGQKEIED